MTLLTLTLLTLLPLLSLPSPSTSETTYTCSRATFYGSPDCTGTATGACGYGEFGRNLNGGDVGAVARLYRNGTGCGGCYQVKCSYPQLCKDEGVKIVVTDHGEGDYTDFIMSARGFVKLARPNMAGELIAYGVVDVEYRRYEFCMDLIVCRGSIIKFNCTYGSHVESRFETYYLCNLTLVGEFIDSFALR